MVDAYLFKTKNIFNKIGDFIKDFAMKNPNENNYQIYVPEKNVLIGYFSNQNLKPSNERVCKTLDKEEKSELKQKITKKNFVKEISINKSSLEVFISSYNTFDICFENLSKSVKFDD